MAKAFVRNIFDASPAAPVAHINAHAWALVTPQLSGSDSFQFFSVCEIKHGGAALKDTHKDADHVYFILSGRGYSIIEGKRFEYGPNDALWIPGNCEHEMYPIGTETLRFAVTLTPAKGAGTPFKATKPFVRNVNDVDPVCPPLHENASSYPLVTPKNGGSDSIEYFITEIRPGGAALKDVHENEDHVYFFLSGKGYSIIEGERFEFGPNDALFIPRNSEHEMYPVGEETLRFIVTFGPARK
ncbi:MAG: hypothetical protein PWQ96_1640 [Clostridia bacterium]|nr:hypothetical protein [Clostridia bacterium]